jgi:hypothetical protein
MYPPPDFSSRASRVVTLEATAFIGQLAENATPSRLMPPQKVPPHICRRAVPHLLSIVDRHPSAEVREDGRPLVAWDIDVSEPPFRSAIRDIVAAAVVIPQGASRSEAAQIMTHPDTIESLSEIALSGMPTQNVEPGQHEYLALSSDGSSLAITKLLPASRSGGCPIAWANRQVLLGGFVGAVTAYAIPIIGTQTGEAYFSPDEH